MTTQCHACGRPQTATHLRIYEDVAYPWCETCPSAAPRVTLAGCMFTPRGE